MSTFTQTKPYFTSFIIYSNIGKPERRLYSSRGTVWGQVDLNAYSSLWYDEILKNGPIVWNSFVELSRDRNNLIIGKLLKETKDDYKNLGYVILGIDKPNFFQGLNFLNPNKESQFFITDKNYELLYQLPENDHMPELQASEILKKMSGSPLSSLQENSMEIALNGKKYIAATVKIEKTGWKIVNVIEVSKLFQDAASIRSITIYIFLAMLFMGSMLAFWLGNSISRPLRALYRMIKVGAELPASASSVFNPTDEVGQIGHRFIKMMKENRELNNHVYDELVKRKKAEIQALQAQIKPHFLYNTLESLNWLAISRKQFEISEVVGSLGKFFRNSISKGKEMITAVMMFPFLWLVRSSLMGMQQIFTFPPDWIPRPFMWSNYSESLTIVPFYRYFLNTMTIELFVVTGVVITSSMTAYSFARLKWPGRNAIFGILLSTLMLPYAVTLIPTFMLWKQLGAINTFLPLTVPAWFGGGVFNIFLFRQFFLTIPKELDESAYMDGARPIAVLWKIILPLSKPPLIVVSIFSFIGVWNDFLGPLIYLSNDDKFTLALGLASFNGMYNAQWGYLMAASTTIVAPIIVLFFVAQRYFVEGITLTGIKG